MGIMNLFRISFQKPELSADEEKRLSKKKQIQEAVKACSSRLNTIISLEDSDKVADAFIISKHFAVDLVNFLMLLYDKDPIDDIQHVKPSLTGFPDPGIAKLLTENGDIFMLLEKEEIEAAEMKKLSEFLNDGFNEVEIKAREIIKRELRTPIDGYWVKPLVKILILLIIAGGVVAVSMKLSGRVKYRLYLEKVSRLPVYSKNFSNGEFLRNWLILEKIPAVHRICYDKDFLVDHGGEMRILPEEGMTDALDDKAVVKWFRHDSESDRIDFNTLFGYTEEAVVYAFTTINSPEKQKAVFSMGSDDTIKVWLNGRLVHENYVFRGPSPDEDMAEVELRKGVNAILVKVTQANSEWALFFRILKK